MIDSHTQNIRRHSDKLSDLETRMRVCCCHMYFKICDDYQSIPRNHLSQSIRFIYNMTSDSQTMLRKRHLYYIVTGSFDV